MKLKPIETYRGYLYRGIEIVNVKPKVFVIQWQMGPHTIRREYKRLQDAVYQIDKLLVDGPEEYNKYNK